MAFAKRIEQTDGVVGIWEITEELDVLYRQIHFSEKERKEFEMFSSIRRKKEFIAVRLLLQKLLGKKAEILYEDSGRPLLKNSTTNLSISHSGDLAVVFLSKKRIGIDVEDSKRKIENIAQRFLHEKEKSFVKDCGNPQKATILLWCAKEAIFKCSEKQGIDFRSEIFIPPFALLKEKKFKGEKVRENENITYQLQHFEYKNNVIVFCVEDVIKS
ncbi:4'-phosphopantetheinyl transferase superfamily protein [Maribellus comscasis]|uniref:4'-phosphopantetheinyl transferase superfamily protein n=1 Tax=Maribellus comscasis TaxID=2681766 RepID=A0A6I6JQD8_9BACT|nr:4'-phosphopantetheinyl transferase superfamily protein [Maribellus comscasis]QGY42432.1 4'-phosphopantetheinyl transferase superfamily protein [Maribellus comscasis]